MIRILTLAFLVLLASNAKADVVLTFDSDLEGLSKQGDGNDVSWSSENGGSVLFNANGGWAGNMAQLNIQDNAAMWAELQSAVVNGGTLSFDIIVNEADVDYSSAPTWFETVSIFNSNGGWDQEINAYGLGSGDWPLSGGQFTGTTEIAILPGSATSDGNLQTDVTGFWTHLHLGLNNDGGAINEATVYLDNLRISAVPEPGSACILGVLVVGIALRRRR